MHEQAIAAAREQSEISGIGWTEAFVTADVDFRSGKWLECVAAARRGIPLAESTGWHSASRSARLLAARACLRSGDFKGAEELTKNFDPDATGTDIPLDAQTSLRLIRAHTGRRDQAWREIEESLDLIDLQVRRFRRLSDQQLFLERKLPLYNEAFDLMLQDESPEGVIHAWTIAERARSFYLRQLMTSAAVDITAAADPAVAFDLVALGDEQGAADEDGRSGTNLYSQARNPAALVRARNLILDRVQEQLAPAAELFRPPRLDLRAEIATLPPDWDVLSFFWRHHPDGARHDLHVFFRPAGGEPVHEASAWTAEDFRKLLEVQQRIDRLMRSGNDTPHDPMGEVMFSLPRWISSGLLPETLFRQIRGGRILISAHGLAGRLPLYALESASGDKLISRAALQFVPTLGLLPLRRARKPVQSVLLIGCADPPPPFPPLAGGAAHLDQLRSLWSEQPARNVVSQHLSSADAIQERIPLEQWQSFDLIDVHCHGIADLQRPFSASLVLGREAVPLASFFRHRLEASLVSLSGCSLGVVLSRRYAGSLVAGDEWIGGIMPLLFAGAGAVLLSSWDANRETADAIAAVFHGRLAKGDPPAVALQTALLSVQNQPQLHWTNWQLIGVPQ